MLQVLCMCMPFKMEMEGELGAQNQYKRWFYSAAGSKETAKELKMRADYRSCRVLVVASTTMAECISRLA